MIAARKLDDVDGETVSTRVDWRSMFVHSKPVLEWAASHPELVGEERADLARRSLVRYYLATSMGPGLVKAMRSVTRAPT